MTDADVEKLMKRCQAGFGGRYALEQAHGCLADCYGTLGRLVEQRKVLCLALAKMVSLYESEQDDTTPRRPAWVADALKIQNERATGDRDDQNQTLD